MASAAIIQEIIVWEKGEDEEEVVVRWPDCHECIKVKHVESLPWWVLQW